MRPIKLQMKAFGSYINPVPIEFEKNLRGEKIFLIHGATGAGKTTILDAICFALYGDKFTGDSQTRDSKMMRSKGVADDVDTEVEFTFALGNKIFKVGRVLKYFPKRKDTKYQLKSELHCDGKLIDSRTESINKKIVELIGFKAAQFRQVVLLPQGEFKKFLAADSNERQDVLNILFDSTPYKEVEDMLSERAKNSAEEVARLKTQRETLERQLHGADNESLAEVEKKISAADEKFADCKKIFDAAQSQLTDEKLTATRFADLNQKNSALENARRQLVDAEKIFAEAQTEYQRCESETERRKNLEQQARDLKKVKDLLDELNNTNNKLNTARGALETAQKNFSDCEDKAKRYDARLNQLNSDKARLELEKIFGEILRLKANLSAAKEKFSVAEKNLESAQIELTRLQIVNNAARLAITLKDGEPCPVCGSREHPAVIKAAIPTVAELRAAENKVNRCTDEKSKLERIVGKIEGELRAKENQLDEHADGAEFDAVKKFFISADKTAADLADCLQRIEIGNDYVEKNKKALETSRSAKNSASNEVAKLEGVIQGLQKKIPPIYLTDAAQIDTDLSAAQREFKRLNDAWTLADKNFRAADKNKSARLAAVKNLQNDCDTLNDSLKGKALPDVAALEQKVNDAQKILNDIIGEKGRLENIRETLKKFSAELDSVKKKLVAAEKIADTWRRLSDVANATGKGESELKISFQRYFLSTMFNDVVDEANNRLKKMSGGRYLFQMKDAGKTKAKSAGLNLQIFDEYTGSTRPVETLSGGESFLASLSLALGLAAVVQNNSGGIKLDTIFIDEGFGTLDTETLDFVMKTLLDLQSGGRLVGIISHVEELKNQMPVRLEVIKTKSGSTAKFNS